VLSRQRQQRFRFALAQAETASRATNEDRGLHGGSGEGSTRCFSPLCVVAIEWQGDAHDARIIGGDVLTGRYDQVELAQMAGLAANQDDAGPAAGLAPDPQRRHARAAADRQ
jgi:hypothetical protein